MTIDQYVNKLNSRYKTGISREHSYRGDLQNLIEALCPSIQVTNEPARIACGAPDYILTKKNIPLGYIEAKDLGDDLEHHKHKEQLTRYRTSLSPLLFTNYIDFWLFRESELVTTISIAKIEGSKVISKPENFDAYLNLIKGFCTPVGITIKSPKRLAELMAGKAKLLADVIYNAINSDEDNADDSTLKDQFKAFKHILIHDITTKGFADIYAQTIAYGMFAARLNDPTLETFTRAEAAELIPKSNPFLRKLFQYIAGYDLDNRIKWIVDDLVAIFLACNVKEILRNYGISTKQEDPIIHFYETFLSIYDPKLRKSRGVWYTPQPVVNFIVRAVDDILKSEFGLNQGIADNSKTKVKLSVQGTDKRFKNNIKTVEEDVHKVQILDPATGTGTFLAEVVKQIYKKFEGQQGIWSDYVETHLLPRLNGFELLMASYAMAHLKLDLLLNETGFKPTKNQRLRVYLTNSLEEHHPDTGTLFASWLSAEASEANFIKRDTPVMVVLGNPPYSISTTNKSEWIESLISDYKKDLKERKINLDDDYIKFIRFGQHFIDKTGEGILAYISNNSFIDGITHRQMRKHLLESFDKIYILDLHGNSRKKEKSPDGSIDQNVFDIRAGVSINIFIKTVKKNKLGVIYHYDLYGKRDFKYEFLSDNSIDKIKWQKLEHAPPYRFFVSKNFELSEIYDKGLKMDELFGNYNSGVESGKDEFIIKIKSNDLIKLESDIKSSPVDILVKKYKINPEKINQVLNDISNSVKTKILYRPFDIRQTLLSKNSEGVFWRPRFSTMKHLLKENVALITKRGFDQENSSPCFITKYISDRRVWTRPGMQGAESILPLYLYLDNTGQIEYEPSTERTPNLNAEIVKQIADKLGLVYSPNPIDLYQSGKDILLNITKDNPNAFAPERNHSLLHPIDILDYIYAVLHSPSYREKYKEFLKIDFPRVPYPKDVNTFWELVKLGGELRKIHLLESPVVHNFITQYPESGDNVVKKPEYKSGNVFINETQYFANVPEVSWNFYIGGYQPAQKWLKDRKDRRLEFEDIHHYQKIIVALTETNRIMKEIDMVDIDFIISK